MEGHPPIQLPPGSFKFGCAGAAVLLARICRELRIQQLVNAMVKYDVKQCKVSPGTLVVAMIINLLVDRKPLYQVMSFYQNYDLETLFTERFDVSALNDDALGRMLDRLTEIDRCQLVQSVALCALRVGEMEVRSVHADTTSITVQGEYNSIQHDPSANSEEKTLNITQGYSKQHRPDLKQFGCGLIVSQDGMPVFGDIRDGNFNDKVWNNETLTAMEQSFLDLRRVVYVADSALMTKNNLQLMAEKKVRFISRLPNTFAAVAQAKAKAFAKKSKWKYVGPLVGRKDAALYQISSTSQEIDGKTYRLLVVQSSAHDSRAAKRWERLVAQEKKAISAAIQELRTKKFACQPDAETALAEFLVTHGTGLHTVTGVVTPSIKVKRPRGRPRKNAVYPTETDYQVDLELHAPTEEVKQAWLKRESSFVMITNLPEDQWSDIAVLSEYKNQHKVERNFYMLKHPIISDGIFLKNPSRVESFGYITILALLVAAFLQHRVRTNLAKEDRPLRLALQQRTTDKPTSVAILKELNDVSIWHFVTPEGHILLRGFNGDLSLETVRLINLAGYDPEICIKPIDT